jgi:hypothetical protein
MSDRLLTALRRKDRNASEVLAALGLDSSVLEEERRDPASPWRLHERGRPKAYDRRRRLSRDQEVEELLAEIRQELEQEAARNAWVVGPAGRPAWRP